jgi:hypothetical protein
MVSKMVSVLLHTLTENPDPVRITHISESLIITVPDGELLNYYTYISGFSGRYTGEPMTYSAGSTDLVSLGILLQAIN